MDIDNEELFPKQCYKYEDPIFDNLKIVYDSSNSKFILWNRFQIFVFNGLDLETPEKIFVPEFEIHLIIASNNYLLCVDTNGIIHLTSMKFKNTSHKKLNTTFQPRDVDIKASIRYKDDQILSLKYDANMYFLCLHKFSSDFQLLKKIILLNEEHWPLEVNRNDKYLLTIHSVDENKCAQIKNIFGSQESGNYDLVLLSLDKFTVYGCFFHSNMIEDDTMLVKLYTCPAEICNIEIIDSEELYLLFGLKMGTVIRLSLCGMTKTPDIVHLNTSLHKMLVQKDSLIYTDGVTMWKAENVFSDDLKFTQFFVKNPNDFVKCGDQIVCTTFSKLAYKFSIEDKGAYLIPKTEDEYCSAEKLFTNSECLEKLFEEIEKNNEVIKKLGKEQDYITALALSKRQDVVEQAIDTRVMVFESYNEVRSNNFMLTEEIKEYFQDVWLFLITITNSNLYNTLNNILSNLIDSISIYITISTSQKILKTTCIKMEEVLKTVNYLVPIDLKTAQTEIFVNIQIVAKIPGALDNKKTLSILYRKDIVLTSEHFIKSCNRLIVKSLKNPKESIEDLIQKVNTVQYGNMFKFTDLSKLEDFELECSFYVKLPTDYEQKFKSDKYCKKHLNSFKTESLIQQWGTEEFLKSKNQINLSIGSEKLRIKIENDGFSNPLLKVTSTNAKTVFFMRNFFANMIYNDYDSYEPGKEFIGYTIYTTTENLHKAIKDSIKNSATSEEISSLVNQFEKNVIGALPL